MTPGPAVKSRLFKHLGCWAVPPAHFQGGIIMFSYREVYSTYDTEEFFGLKAFLENEGLDMKTKVRDPRGDRTLISSLLGNGRVSAMDFGNDRHNLREYVILAKKDSVDTAYYLIGKFKNNR